MPLCEIKNLKREIQQMTTCLVIRISSWGKNCSSRLQFMFKHDGLSILISSTQGEKDLSPSWLQLDVLKRVWQQCWDTVWKPRLLCLIKKWGSQGESSSSWLRTKYLSSIFFLFLNFFIQNSSGMITSGGLVGKAQSCFCPHLGWLMLYCTVIIPSNW